jgi:hypothetical protein
MKVGEGEQCTLPHIFGNKSHRFWSAATSLLLVCTLFLATSARNSSVLNGSDNSGSWPRTCLLKLRKCLNVKE